MKTSNESNITKQACEWIAKLHEADLSDNERQELKAWMDHSQENRTEIRRIAKQWEDLNALTLLAVPSDQHKPEKTTRSHFFSLASGQFSLAAIAVFAVLVIGFWPKTTSVSPVAQELKSYSTRIGEQRLITLPDSSTVLLNTKSQFSIAYTPEFRDIYLIEGEAHFEVQPNNVRPFRVFAGKSKVRAIGTAFSVHLKKKTVDITVTHGIVEIDSIRDNVATSVPQNPNSATSSRAIVKAGHAAKFDQIAGSIETKVLSGTSFVPAWHHGKLKFTGEPLELVVEEISRYSPLSIVILDSELRNLRIGGLFDTGETEKMFEALEKGFGIKVEYINERLVHLTALKPNIN